ncbi:MAG TPA: NAD(P)-dependent oxidoreductase [Xanthobacteraceae bacterium]|nr:NAD(P)-dependent oxidoreductase [Xanthobacteraceae bacterium]
MTVVITGASSFVGHHLARHWAQRGHRVVATLSRPRARYEGIEARRLAAIAPFVEFHPLDLREPRTIMALLDRTAPTLWIHHAGYATNYASPDYDLEAGHAVNVAPLAVLYAALARTRCGVILTGSSAEYAAQERGHRESDACLPDTPYGLSKLAATLRARQVAALHEVPTRVARLYVPFGALDNPQKLLALTVARLRAGEPVMLSACTQRRDFIGITDVCEAYGRIADDLPRATFDIFNIARGEGIVLRDLLVDVADRFGAPRDLLRFGERPMRPGEPPVSFAEIEKARRLLGWNPSPLAEALDRDLLRMEENIGSFS